MIALPTRLQLKLVIGIAGALLLALLIHDRNRWKSKTEHYAELIAGERAAHAATIANVRAAAERARLADAANSARVSAEQGAINERTRDEFESRIAAARAAARRVRPHTEADHSGGRATPVSGLPSAPERAVEGAGEDGLSRSDRLRATEQAIQLDELIKWVRAQAAVETSKD